MPPLSERVPGTRQYHTGRNSMEGRQEALRGVAVVKSLRKIVLFAIVALLVLAVSRSASFAAGQVRVALVLTGFLGDRSFNDSAHEGLQRAVEEFGIELKVLESRNPADWEPNLVAMAAENYDLVVGATSQFQEIIAANAEYFPDVKFAIIDAVVNAPNVMSALFAQNEGTVLSAAYIYEKIWNQPLAGNGGAVKNMVYRLRKKLLPGGLDIQARRGDGYVFMSGE